ncbi:MAG: SIMPL domain-containing protein [bacterium]|nr:SIMPL domain-containing protein [bacterium]
MEEKNLVIAPKPPILFPLIILLLFFLLAALFFKVAGPIPLSVNSIVTNKTDLFTVSGVGKATAPPDIAKINLGITSSATTVKDAQTQANTIMNKITSDLKKQEIEDKDLKTVSYYINPNYDFSQGRQKINGYQVNISLEVKVRDLDKANSVIDTATADGANLVGNLKFTVNDNKLKDLQKQARDAAIKEAKEKAESMAQSAGIRLGRIVNIQETGTTPIVRPMLALEKPADGQGGGTSIERGEQEITLTISLSYEIQ